MPRFIAWSVAILLLASTVSARADLEGVYFRIESASAAWYQVLPLEGTGRYRITTIYGEGLEVTQQTDGSLVIDSGGSGGVDIEGRIRLMPDGAEDLVLTRVFGTDQTFALTAPSTVPPDPLLADDWDIDELLLNPVTGEVLPQFDGSLIFQDVFTNSIVGNGLRMDDSFNPPNGYQGPMLNAKQGIYRIINNPQFASSVVPPYATLPDSTNNFPRDVVGQVTYSDINHFHVQLLLTNYTADFGPRLPYLDIRGSRVNPLPAGDLNGDRLVDAGDRARLVGLMGISLDDARFELAADLDRNDLIDRRDLSLFDGTPETSMAINDGFSRLWYDPMRDGEGFDIKLLDNGTAFVTWFTYLPNGGRQAWLTGSGVIRGDTLSVSPTLIADGSPFGPEYDPEDVVLSPWGEIHFHFTSCIEGAASYSGPPGYGNGTISLRRLSTPAGLDCEGGGAEPSDDSRFTGVWFDPVLDGTGWIVEAQADGNAVVTWYTYDAQGELFWLIGSGRIDGNVLNIVSLLSARGARFGDAFDPDDVVREDWGSLRMRLETCGTARFEFASVLPEFGSGLFDAVRLGQVAGLDCSD